MENHQNFRENPLVMEILGIGLVKISQIDTKGRFDVLFQKGIGVPLIQNVIELYKKEIIHKKQGSSIIPLEKFNLFIHYFNHNQDILVIIYMEEKNSSVNFSKLYFLSKKINRKFQVNEPVLNIIDDFDTAVKIPKTDGIIAIFIIGAAGSPYISKINKDRSEIADHEVHIGGFISALLSFSNTIIGEETGAKLKEINFGNQQFYVITKNDVIFAFLVETMTSLLQRYMYLVADEFLYQFKNLLKEFNGDITPFNTFEEKINQYFII
ncbi:MAG: hypothetical protein KGD58_07825 [Candidatus Lokiarchaeota archaeon]|nr:hypothetical protein [Candidatus Lokiarchaeota archaeon]